MALSTPYILGTWLSAGWREVQRMEPFPHRDWVDVSCRISIQKMRLRIKKNEPLYPGCLDTWPTQWNDSFLQCRVCSCTKQFVSGLPCAVHHAASRVYGIRFHLLSHLCHHVIHLKNQHCPKVALLLLLTKLTDCHILKTLGRSKYEDLYDGYNL